MLSGAARLAGVVGWPVAQSLSPRLNGYWLAHYRIDGAYVPLAVRREVLEEVLQALLEAGFRGVNLARPHRTAGLELCDELDPMAGRMGAVNTLVFEDERIYGANSDAFGFVENLRQQAPEWSPAVGPALVLGAGGAARAVVVALQDLGVPEIRLANRGMEHAVELKRAVGGAIRTINWNRRSDEVALANLVVNTTSLGMVGQPELDLDLTRLPERTVICDTVFRPLETRLLARARRRGNPVVDGLGMLLHQARPGFEAWYGISPEVTPALRASVLGAEGDGDR